MQGVEVRARPYSAIKKKLLTRLATKGERAALHEGRPAQAAPTPI